MGQTPDEITQRLAERLCWEVARRDDARVARRLYRKHLVGFNVQQVRQGVCQRGTAKRQEVIAQGFAAVWAGAVGLRLESRRRQGKVARNIRPKIQAISL